MNSAGHGEISECIIMLQTGNQDEMLKLVQETHKLMVQNIGQRTLQLREEKNSRKNEVAQVYTFLE